MTKASLSIFSEHMIINTLSKDIADMHLAGEINISNSGVWGLIPDTIFLDANDFVEGKLDLGGKFLNVGRIANLNNLDDYVTALPMLISLLSREASTEIVLSGIIHLLLRQIKDPDEITSQFARILMMSSTAPSYSFLSSGLPITTITIPAADSEFDTKSVCALLNGYRKYVDSTPVPRIGLSLNYNKSNRIINNYSESIASIVRAGGIISISQDALRGNNGLRKSLNTITSPTVMTLQSMSINLPRLAYQSNKDETYFRARLALMIKPAIATMLIRKKAVIDLLRKGMLPTFSNTTRFMQNGTTNIVINLTGTKESVYDILGHDYDNRGIEVLQKVLKTAVDVASDQGKQVGDYSIGIAMISDDSAERFAKLDSDKYGKISSLSSQQIASSYSQGFTLNGKKLLSSSSSDDNKLRSIVEECVIMDNLLNGGLSVNVDMSDLSSTSEVKNAIDVASSSLQFFHPSIKLVVCNNCGNRSKYNAEKCEFCKSPNLSLLHS
jgi:ribonucleoside-triphosphate reductase